MDKFDVYPTHFELRVAALVALETHAAALFEDLYAAALEADQALDDLEDVLTTNYDLYDEIETARVAYHAAVQQKGRLAQLFARAEELARIYTDDVEVIATARQGQALHWRHRSESAAQFLTHLWDAVIIRY